MLLHILNCLLYAGLVAFLYRDVPRAAVVLFLLLAGLMFLCRGMKRRAWIGTVLGLASVAATLAVGLGLAGAILAGAATYIFGGCIAYDVLRSKHMHLNAVYPPAHLGR